MFVLGIVGGVASGKSAVAHWLKAHHRAVLLDADRTGHEVLRDPEVVAALRTRWGDGVVNAAGEIRRDVVASRVFAEHAEQERQYLNDVTHPRIRQRLLAELQTARDERQPLAVIDAALLFESQWNLMCDGVLFVDTPEAMRRQRAADQRGWTESQLAAREAAQWSVEKKQSLADWTLKNSGSLADLEREIAEWFEQRLRPKIEQD